MPDPDLAAKVAFLSNPASYPLAPRAVAVVETHMSWVFLTETHAYKLKKGMRLDGVDLARLEAREAQCRSEVLLNRRLSSGVYLGVVPLTVDPRGTLQFDLGGTVVDWLVWMRRLPDARMLDRMIAAGSVDAEGLRDCVARLGRFYRAQPREPLTPAEFRARLAQRIAHNAAALCRHRAFAGAGIDRIALGQRHFVERHDSVLDRRVLDARVVEGHGDLRPEHVCLETPPQVIDCLEFSRELRVVDAAEEIAFLALECERLGAPELRETIVAAYTQASGDRPPGALLDFYQSVHAGIRAKLAVWHASDPGPAGEGKWLDRARDYVRLADRHLAAAQRPVTA